MKNAKIGLVDDHPFVTKGLGLSLNSEPGLSHAWTAHSVADASRLLVEQPVDVVIVDLKMGAATAGFDVLRFIAAKGLATRSVVLSSYSPEKMVRDAALLGASAYFLKTDKGDGLIEAVKTLAEGPAKKFLGPFSSIAKPNVFLDLSVREREVCLQIALGKSNLEIAEALGLKVGTVKTHLESIYKKLGASNRTDALRAALAEGYLSVEDLQS